MASRNKNRAAATNRWLTTSAFEVRDDPVRHNDTSEKTGSSTKGTGEAPPAWDKVWRASMRANNPAWRIPCIREVVLEGYIKTNSQL